MANIVAVYYGVPIDEDDSRIYRLLDEACIDWEDEAPHHLHAMYEGDAYLGICLLDDYAYGMHLDPLIEEANQITSSQREELEASRKWWKAHYPQIGTLIPDDDFGLYIASGHS